MEDLKKSHRKIEEYVKCKDKKMKWKNMENNRQNLTINWLITIYLNPIAIPYK